MLFHAVVVVFALCLVAAMVLGGSKAYDHFFLANDDYNIRKVHTFLNDVLTHDDALALTGIAEGKNIFSVNFDKARDALRGISMADQVRVEHSLTERTVTITVTARRPAAWVVDKGMAKEDFSPGLEAFLTDENGNLVTLRIMRREFLDLPVIYGVQTDKLDDPTSLAKEDLRVALKFIETVKRRGAALFDLRSVDVSRGWALEVENDQGSKFLFSQKNLLTDKEMNDQLYRMQRVIDDFAGTNQVVGTANLAVARNVPVTFQVAQADPEPFVEPSPSKPAAPITSKKPAPAPAKKPTQPQKR